MALSDYAIRLHDTHNLKIARHKEGGCRSLCLRVKCDVLKSMKDSIMGLALISNKSQSGSSREAVRLLMEGKS